MTFTDGDLEATLKLSNRLFLAVILTLAICAPACSSTDAGGKSQKDRPCETTSECKADEETCAANPNGDGKICTKIECSKDDECKDGAKCLNGLCSGGGCEPKAGQCPNVCAAGSVTSGGGCLADGDCACGLSCAKGDAKVQGDKSCPNLTSTGAGIETDSCQGPGDCQCGLRCKDNKCTPYDGEHKGCDCAGKSCSPMTGTHAGCTCDSGGGGCTPNKNVKCPCPGGTEGVQTCNGEGTAFSPCDCGGGTDGADGIDGSTGTDGTDGQCQVTQAKYKKVCAGGDVYWEDNCGTKGTIFEKCQDGQTCGNGQCNASNICIPKSKTLCDEGQLYFFDSCGKKQGVPFGGCKPEEFCTACTLDEQDKPDCPKCDKSVTACCVKPFFDGDWMMTAKSKPGACTSFPAQVLKLKINGTKATGSVTSIGVTVEFDGALDGKHLTMKTTYSSSGVDVTEDLDVFFKSPTLFEGTVYVVQTMPGLGPLCSAAFEITGKKQF